MCFNPLITDGKDVLSAYWLPTPHAAPSTATSQNEVATLGHLHDLALLHKLADSGTSAGTVDLQTIHNTVDGNELHLRLIAATTNLTLGTSARSLS